MSFYGIIVRNIFNPLIEKVIGRRYWTLYEEYYKKQFLPKKEIEKKQLEKLKVLVKHAFENVPMYRELFNRVKVKPENIRRLKDIEKLPIVDKSIIRRYFPDKYLAQNINKDRLILDSTSGSTGSPFQYYLDKKFQDNKMAFQILACKMAGLEFGEKYISLWGKSKFNFNSFILENILKRKKTISAYDLNDDTFLKYFRLINRYKPQRIEGYASYLILLAKYIEKNKLNFDFKLKAILSSAEKLSFKDKEFLKKIFKCPIFERYGCREFGAIAMECEKHKGYHIFHDNVIVEIVNKKGESANKGEILITDLNNFVMPFIRYKIGDFATSGNYCDCGKNGQLIKSVDGRNTDYIITPKGKVSLLFVSGILLEKYYSLINNFQVIQIDKKNLVLKIVPQNKFTKSCQIKLIRLLKEKVNDINITIKIVRSIPLSPSGKTVLLKSYLKF